MLATIGLHGLRLECIIGVLPAERERPQALSVDVEVDRDITAAVADERLDATLDYRQLAGLLEELVKERRFLLLEALAHEAAAAVLQRFPSITRVRLEVRKPAAIAAAADSFVRVERLR